MKIHIGSKNPTKIQAVKDALVLYPYLFPKPEFFGVDIDVELFGHPKSLEETVEGAIDRAKKAFQNCDFSFGLEGGLMAVPHTNSGYMEVGACAIYDGKEMYLGLSPAFEWPKNVTDLIIQNKADASQALKQVGFTNHEKLGAVKGGAIGRLTDYKMTREDFTKYSIMMALVRLDKKEIYR